MAAVAAAVAIMVTTAVAVSVLMVLPAAALAEVIGERNAAGRKRVWLAALFVPPVAGIAAAARSLSLYSQGVLATPHLGGLRPHLCLLPLLKAPGEFMLRALIWLSLLLVAAALMRTVGGAVSGHLLRKTMLDSGRPLEVAGLEAHKVLAVDLRRPTSFTAGLLRPMIVVSTSLRDRLGPKELAAIVAHESAHARRMDNLLSLLADVCSVLMVISPAAWYFRGRLRTALEEAADDEAVAAGVAREALERALAALDRVGNGAPQVPTLATLLVPRPTLADERQRRLRKLDADVASVRSAVSGEMHALIAAAIGLLVLGALLLVAHQPLDDSLFCAAEQLMAAITGY